jgi:hypothetical protein
MRGDEQAGLCQSEDGEGILVDPVHAPNLKALPLSAAATALSIWARVGRSLRYLRRLQFHIVRSTAYR